MSSMANMDQLAKLKMEACNIATSRGHSVSWQINNGVATGTCQYCQSKVECNPAAGKGRRLVSGEAVDSNCSGLLRL